MNTVRVNRRLVGVGFALLGMIAGAGCGRASSPDVLSSQNPKKTAPSKLVNASGHDTSPNLVADPGFEAGDSGFYPQYNTSVVSQATGDSTPGYSPLDGGGSLRVSIAPYDNVWWKTSDVAAYPGAVQLSVTATVRRESSQGAGFMQLCAMVYVGSALSQACVDAPTDQNAPRNVSVALALDPADPLTLAGIRLMGPQGGPALIYSLDDVSVTVDYTPGPGPSPSPSPGVSPSPTPSESPSPTPTPGLYRGYDYTRPAQRPYISLAPYLSVNRSSSAYARFKNWVDQAVAGNPGYLYSPVDSVILYELATSDANRDRYIDDAISRTDARVASEESIIASGGIPEIAGDSYYNAHIAEEVAIVYDHGYARMTASQRSRWLAYMQQAVFNIWHPSQAQWGGRPAAWSGWSTNDPGNNYHFGFLAATLGLALANWDQNTEWFTFLQTYKFGPLVDYYASLPGGGSREGTGYGTAQMNLFELYMLWKASTGEDLSAYSTHARDTIDYWVHATAPTLDRFAPFGDQSRDSSASLFDYQRRLVLELVVLNSGTAQAQRGQWWLTHNSVSQMQNGFQLRYDLLSVADAAASPTETAYRAEGVGHFFGRASWATDASWIDFVAGKFDQSHADEDQGSFNLYRRGWQAVNQNIWTHSGIQQKVGNQNSLRFEQQGGVTIGQTRYTSLASTMTYTNSNGSIHIDADLANAYANSSGLVRGWTRSIDFANQVTRVVDNCSVASGVQAVFQLQLPIQPTANADGSYSSGALVIRPIAPANPGVTMVSMQATDSDYSQGYRMEIRDPAGGCHFEVELDTP